MCGNDCGISGIRCAIQGVISKLEILLKIKPSFKNKLFFCTLPLCFFTFHFAAEEMAECMIPAELPPQSRSVSRRSELRRGENELVAPNSWVYDALTAVALESGIVQFTDNTPLTIAEIKSYLHEIDPDSLSPSGRNQYAMIREYFSKKYLSFDSDVLSLGIDPSINPQSYYKSNDDIDWVYDRYKRKPFIDVPVILSVSDYATMFMDLYLGQNQCAMEHPDNYFNAPLSADYFDINFPHTAYGSTGFKFTDFSGLSFQLGMGGTSIGRTQTGSIIYSDFMTQASYAQLSFYSPNFKYTMLVTQLNVDKYMYSHRLEFRFFKKLTVSVMESTLTNAEMELRYFNPLTVFHGAAPWRDYTASSADSEDSHNCEFLGISVQYTPVKNVRLYGLFAMNQFQTAYETSNYPDDNTPNSMGGQLGFESFIPSGVGRFHFGVEGYYANPYLYIKQSPDWSLCRTYEENIGDKNPFYEWVGSPFGPDAIACSLTLGYENTGLRRNADMRSADSLEASDSGGKRINRWSVNLTYLYLCQGENSGTRVFHNDGFKWGGTDVYFDMADKDKWAYPTDGNGRNKYAVAPTGTPQYTNRLSLRGTWDVCDNLSFTLVPSYVIIFNNGNKTGKTDKGVEIAFAVKWSIIR
ncbi:hypothetical protein HRI96_05450 [Treponema parvum]|uniref:Capsule assembly Wzi family protein n=1 Tax=Treponema parvum TaxID=138851 RepID=A0A975EZL5_9SPIR|nr:hypothetical protein [Treponema parvum]QTQ11693.1 hypothetical protein HRI96_05450 [Treponema parvum]